VLNTNDILSLELVVRCPTLTYRHIYVPGLARTSNHRGIVWLVYVTNKQTNKKINKWSSKIQWCLILFVNTLIIGLNKQISKSKFYTTSQTLKKIMFILYDLVENVSHFNLIDQKNYFWHITKCVVQRRYFKSLQPFVV